MKKLLKREASALISSGYTKSNNKKLDSLSSFYDFYFNAKGEIIRLERFSGKGVLYSSLDEAFSTMGLNSTSDYPSAPTEALYDNGLDKSLDFYVSELYKLLSIEQESNSKLDFSSVKEVSDKLKKLNFCENYTALYVPLVAFITKILLNKTNGDIVLSFNNQKDFLVKSGGVFFNPYKDIFKLYCERKIKIDLEALILAEYHTA
jgi:hypothetical protein